MDAALARSAAARHGVFTREQALTAGETGSSIRRRLRTGDWLQLSPATYVAASTPVTIPARLAAVALSSPIDYAVSQLCAAQIWGLRAPAPTTPTIVIPDTSRLRRAGVVISRVRPQVLHRRQWRGGVPVTDVETTLIQCAAVITRDQLITLVEDAVRSRRTSLPRLWQRLRRGTSGSAALRRLLEELDRGFHDRWMRVVFRGLRRRGAPIPEHHQKVRINGMTLYPDGLWRLLRIICEIDDFQTHGDPVAQTRDRRRDRKLRLAGYEILRTTPREIRDNLEEVLDDIIAAIAQRTAAVA